MNNRIELIYHKKEVELASGVAANSEGLDHYEDMASCKLTPVTESSSIPENTYLVMASASANLTSPQQQNIYDCVDTVKKK